MNPFLRYLADKNSVHTQTDRQTDRHTPMTTRPCGLRRAGKYELYVSGASSPQLTSIQGMLDEFVFLLLLKLLQVMVLMMMMMMEVVGGGGEVDDDDDDK